MYIKCIYIYVICIYIYIYIYNYDQTELVYFLLCLRCNHAIMKQTKMQVSSGWSPQLCLKMFKTPMNTILQLYIVIPCSTYHQPQFSPSSIAKRLRSNDRYRSKKSHPVRFAMLHGAGIFTYLYPKNSEKMSVNIPTPWSIRVYNGICTIYRWHIHNISVKLCLKFECDMIIT